MIKRLFIVACLAAVVVGAGAQKKGWSEALNPYFAPAGAEAAAPDAEGFVRRWLLLEPIVKPNRSNTVFTDSYIREAFAKEYFPGQFAGVPKAGSTVKVSTEEEIVEGSGWQARVVGRRPLRQTLRWHAMDSRLYNVKLFRFATGLEKPRYGVIFWAVTVVECDEDIPGVRMAVGSNSASMWWLNGEEAAILSGDRRMVKDDCVSRRLTLKKGRNIVRGAVINGPGMSDFCLRFIDENGEPVRNLSLSLTLSKEEGSRK